MNDTSLTVVGSGITIEIPSPFQYKSEKVVPWNYECNILAHRNALLKVLNQAYVAHDISVEKLDHIVGNITVGNFIAFNDEEIPSGGRGNNKALHITIKCKDHAIPRMLIDNGSALNVMPRSTLTRLPIDMTHMRDSHMIVRAFDGTKREVVGDKEILVKISPCMFNVQFQVMDITPSYNCLLRRLWIHMTGAVLSSLHQKVKFIIENQLISISAEEDILAIQSSSALYVEAMEEVPECSFKSFDFVNATYVGEGAMIPTLCLSAATKMEVKQTVGRGCRAGLGLRKNLQGISHPLISIKNKEKVTFILKHQQRSIRYLEWVANIVPVPKKDGKLRICVDYRDLNRASPKASFPLPHIDTLVDNTAKHALFSFMDGYFRYNQIKMAPEDMEKTTFVTIWGMFCYKVMPFGLKNASATYQKAMVTLFHDMMHKEIEIYVDDMIAKSRTKRDHTINLKKLFERLRKFQLKLNLVKCTFGVTFGKLLGFVVSEKGIEVDSDKIQAIQELPPPKTQKEVRGFLRRLNCIA
ncbi:Reverse transcriptase domain - like 10 [Theobroma cacao]|nr:Reverse transcriptase domain - like 10 [Theobroma cacao]